MKFTVNTDNKTIEIHGSFKFEDLDYVQSKLPEEWRQYSIQLAKEDVFQWPLLLPNPPYPIQTYQSQCCGNCTICPFAVTVMMTESLA